MKAMQHQPVEFSFTAAYPHADPFRTVALSAVFTAPDGSQKTVPAFWAGGDCWRIRYSAAQTGRHTFATVCSDTADAGLHGQTGAVEVVPYTGDNPLYRHGSITRRGGDRYLTHQDGTPFYWLGDTWWMALTTRLRFPEDFAVLTADRVDKGFSVVQIIAGLYPDMQPFDDRGRNEAGFPWDEQFQSIQPAYFDMADRRIAYLCEQGITPCIVGCWGFFMKFAGKETILRHWQYLIARWSAYPVAWCIAGEANMAFYDERVPMEEHLRQSRRDWNEVTRFVRDADPFHRLVTIHPTQYGHEQIEDETLLDLDMLQTGHGGPTSLVPSMRIVKTAVDRGTLPVINAEACYEGICGSSYADVQRYLYLSNFMLGACGHTYGANGIWQLNSLEKSYGVSPHGAHWGDTPWQEAYRLPGSLHIGRCKKFLTQFEWWRFTYRPDWVESPCSLEALDGHFAAGIPGEVRVIYKPNFGGNFWGETEIRGIESGMTYRALRFNPLTDATADLGVVQPDANGCWRAPRVDAFGDWLYALVRV